MVLITKLFIIQNLIVNLITLNISGKMAKIMYRWNVIIFLIGYKNICYKLWPISTILPLWNAMISIGGKCSYTEKVLHIVF